MRLFLLLVLIHCGYILLPDPKRRFNLQPKVLPSKISHYPLITGDTFRCFCDCWADEYCMDFDPALVKKGTSVFVSLKYIDFFLEIILPEIQNPFVLVTSNGDGTIDDKYLPFLENEKIIKWFGRNIIAKHPKLQCIPLGVNWLNRMAHSLIENYFSNLQQENYFSEKSIYCYLNIRKTFSARTEVLDIFSQKSFCTISKTVPFETYMSHLGSARFVISPRGVNIDCFRTWEALYAGSIPVVESRGINEVYEGLPVIIVDDLRTVTKELLDAEFEKLKE
ncbi:MAG TPA: hypothetical protein VGO47_01370, partial [Chlamydiales bacterium]|nr:hypothetical protein [Chlamydiales bacterium]